MPAAWPAARIFALLRSERRLSVSRGEGVSTSNVSRPGNGAGVDKGLTVVVAATLVSAWPPRIGGRNFERPSGFVGASKPFVAMKPAIAACASG